MILTLFWEIGLIFQICLLQTHRQISASFFYVSPHNLLHILLMTTTIVMRCHIALPVIKTCIFGCVSHLWWICFGGGKTASTRRNRLIFGRYYSHRIWHDRRRIVWFWSGKIGKFTIWQQRPIWNNFRILFDDLSYESRILSCHCSASELILTAKGLWYETTWGALCRLIHNGSFTYRGSQSSYAQSWLSFAISTRLINFERFQGLVFLVWIWTRNFWRSCGLQSLRTCAQLTFMDRFSMLQLSCIVVSSWVKK